jgi:hypothetical protein
VKGPEDGEVVFGIEHSNRFANGRSADPDAEFVDDFFQLELESTTKSKDLEQMVPPSSFE